MQRSQRPLGRPKKAANEKSTKEIISEVATDMFLEKGYPFVSMDDVALKSDVTKATVYYYYKTKSDLFTEAMIQLMARITGSIKAILSTEEALKDQLFILAKVHIQATMDIDIPMFMKEAGLSLSKEQQQQMEETETKMYQTLEERFQVAIIAGEIPETNPQLATHIFMSMITVGKNMKQTSTTLNDMVTEIIHFFWNGISNHG